MKTSRQIRTLAVTAAIFCLTVTVSFSASVRLYFVDPFTDARDTNDIYATAIGTNVLSSGGVVTRGITRKLTPTSDGSITNTFSVGHYSITNRVLGYGVVIRVPDSSSLYDYTNLLVSGYNTFVTIENGDAGTAVAATGQAAAVTNAGVVTITVQNLVTNFGGLVTNVTMRASGSAGTKALSVRGVDNVEQLYVDDGGVVMPALVHAVPPADGGFLGVDSEGIISKSLNAANLTNIQGASITGSLTNNAATVSSVAGNAAQIAAIMDTNGVVVFNVEKYGALPFTESTIAIQAAIDAAIAAGGGIVYFPSNNYLTSNTLTFSELVHFEGNSSGVSSGYTISNTTGSDVLAGAAGIFGFSIKDMSFAAPLSTSATNAIIKLSADSSTGFGSASLQGITAQGGRVGLLTSNFYTSEIKDCRWLGMPIGVNFTGVAVGRIKIEGGGAGSGNGIGYVIDQGTYFVFDGVDMGGTTNMIKVNRAAFVTVQNCNLEGGLLSSDDTIDRAYILFNPTNASGLLRVINTRFGAGNGTPLTLSHSITVSNAALEIGGGNTWSHAGPTGQFIEEWDTFPCSTYVTYPENYSGQLWVTNRTVLAARKPRQYIQDLQNSGRSSFFSDPRYWGAVWYDTRTNANSSDALYHHAKMADGTYRGVNLFAPYTDSYIIGRFGVGSNAYSGWNGAGGARTGLDVAANYVMTIGSDQNTDNRTTATAKRGRIGGAPYTTSRLPVSLFETFNDASHNTLFYGGGWTGYDAVTRHRFYAASAIQTTVGTLNFEITHTGLYANTNFHAVAVTATNFIAMPTNYVAANFAPVAGMVKFVSSNNVIYAVTQASTNALY